MKPARAGKLVLVRRPDLDRLFEALQKRGFQIVGPTLRDGAILFDEVKSTADLPAGWTDEQDGGAYRLKKRNDAALFGYTVGPHSWKKFLHPSVLNLWKARRDGNGFQFIDEKKEIPKYAFIGARSCDLHAIATQDKVFIKGNFVDPHYRARREKIFVVAVNCGQTGGTCFCVSMKTGPKATLGFDLALTEILENGRHDFLVETGTPAGAEVLAEVPHAPAGRLDEEAAARIVAKTAAQMGRKLDTDGIKELLYRNQDHPRWDEVATRCLSCANCTLVCPTCFCTTVEDVTDLSGDHAERWRKWDSCFTFDFTYIHGGAVRPGTKGRYRHWMTHKLATWHDQFGVSGCVGCGRCITWCPVGIDLTEETAAIRAAKIKEK